MRRLLPWTLALVLALGFALRLDRALTQPLGPQAAASGSLTRGLAEAGWQPLGESPLLADGSFTAQGFRRETCQLEVALLPPGPQYLDVLREAWGGRGHLLERGVATPITLEAEGRLRHLARHLRASLGLGAPPALFRLAIATQGDCPGLLLAGLH